MDWFQHHHDRRNSMAGESGSGPTAEYARNQLSTAKAGLVPDIIDSFRILFGSVFFLVAVVLFVATGISLQVRLSNTSVMAEVTFVGERCALACNAIVSGNFEPYECNTTGPFPELVKGGFCEVVPKQYFEARDNQHSVLTELTPSVENVLRVGGKAKLLMSDNGLLQRRLRKSGLTANFDRDEGHQHRSPSHLLKTPVIFRIRPEADQC